VKDWVPTRGGVEIRIQADPEYLCVVRRAARQAAQLVGLSEGETDAVILALDEALTNVIRHSYGGPCGNPIIVGIQRVKIAGRTAMELAVRDFGRQVDPAEIRSRDLDDVRPGGLGVHIIRSVMDEVEYSCPVEGGMLLRMVKYLQESQARTPAGSGESVEKKSS